MNEAERIKFLEDLIVAAWGYESIVDEPNHPLSMLSREAERIKERRREALDEEVRAAYMERALHYPSSKARKDADDRLTRAILALEQHLR